jgi:hypothetical protein
VAAVAGAQAYAQWSWALKQLPGALEAERVAQPAEAGLSQQKYGDIRNKLQNNTQEDVYQLESLKNGW